MNRMAVLGYLAAEFAPLAAAAGVTATDDGPGWAMAIDAAFRPFRVPQSGLATASVDDVYADDLLAVAAYYGLRTLCRRLAVAVDIKVDQPAVMKTRSQLSAHAQRLLEQAEVDITSRGYGPRVFTESRLGLDFLEPFPEFDSVYLPSREAYGYGDGY
jgi:hypothetical protein